MAHVRASWIFLRDATVSPDGPLQLGTILSNPTDIHSIICRGPTPTDIVTSYRNALHSETGQTRTDGNMVSSFLNSILGSNASREGQEPIAVTFDSLQTTQFFPSVEYVMSCLGNEEAKNWIKARVFGRQLYVVTGVRVAHGVKIKSERSKVPGSSLAQGVACLL